MFLATDYDIPQYLSAKVLQLSGSASCDNQRVRIIPRHVQFAIRNDLELCNLCLVRSAMHARRHHGNRRDMSMNGPVHREFTRHIE